MRFIHRKRRTPAPPPKVRAWRRHVEAVGQELANAAAPPPWWHRMWSRLREDYGLDEPAPAPRPSGPSIPARHEYRCDHLDAEATTLGALIRRPKVGDQVLLGVEAMHCKRCGMTVAVMR